MARAGEPVPERTCYVVQSDWRRLYFLFYPEQEEARETEINLLRGSSKNLVKLQVAQQGNPSGS